MKRKEPWMIERSRRNTDADNAQRRCMRIGLLFYAVIAGLVVSIWLLYRNAYWR